MNLIVSDSHRLCTRPLEVSTHNTGLLRAVELGVLAGELPQKGANAVVNR